MTSGQATASASHVANAAGQASVGGSGQFRRRPTSGDTGYDPDPLSKTDFLNGRAEFKGAETSDVDFR